MKKRATGQSSFSDLAVGGLGGPKTAALLAKLDAAVPWGELVKPVRKLPEYAKYIDDPSRPGERPIDPAVMLRGLMLQKWFNLSDPQLEEHGVGIGHPGHQVGRRGDPGRVAEVGQDPPGHPCDQFQPLG